MDLPLLQIVSAARLLSDALAMLQRANDHERLHVDAQGRIDAVISGPAHAGGVVHELDELLSAGAQFGSIYADPPWPYENSACRGAAEDHYRTMSLAAIEALPIASLAKSDAHLHLWTTNGFLFEAKQVIEAWGFTYKSCLVWIKPQLGAGNYWRVSHEFLLLGVRGNAVFADRTQQSWCYAPRTKHSAKPALVRQLIERVSPGPYLELFGRRSAANWTVWGNEFEADLFSEEDQSHEA